MFTFSSVKKLLFYVKNYFLHLNFGLNISNFGKFHAFCIVPAYLHVKQIVLGTRNYLAARPAAAIRLIFCSIDSINIPRSNSTGPGHKMSSFELWYSDEESDDITEEDDLLSVRIERRRLRDASNPLELPSNTYVLPNFWRFFFLNFFFFYSFVQYFRVSKDLFKYLLDILETHLGPAVGSASVLPIIKLAAALRFFAEGGYQKGAGNDIFVGVAQPTMSKMLSRVIDVFEQHLCAAEITFPTSEQDKNSIKMGFFAKTGFPGVIGCVDGTHVKIVKPTSDIQHLYYNRKGYHSLNVMVVCIHD